MLKKYTKLSCIHASNGITPKSGHVYLAPSDHHLLIDEGKILITKGAHENRSRPAIDPWFRSAAVAYNNKVIGILLKLLICVTYLLMLLQTVSWQSKKRMQL